MRSLLRRSGSSRWRCRRDARLETQNGSEQDLGIVAYYSCSEGWLIHNLRELLLTVLLPLLNVRFDRIVLLAWPSQTPTAAAYSSISA